MKLSKITVEKAVLNLKGTDVELTVEEAKTLQTELDSLLGNKQTIINIPNNQPYPVSVHPLYIHQINPPVWPFTGPTCAVAGHSGSPIGNLGVNTCSQIN